MSGHVEDPFSFESLLLRIHTLKPSEQVRLDELQAGICFCCGGPGRVYRRNTLYHDALSNFSCACEACEKEDYEEMEALWKEYYSGLM